MKAIQSYLQTSYLLSDKPNPLSFLSYQLVYTYQDRKKYIKSFNILGNGKILRKVYLQQLMDINEVKDIKTFLLEQIILLLEANKVKSQTDEIAKKKPDNQARMDAAQDLFTVFGL